MGRQSSRIYFQGKDHKDCYITNISTQQSSNMIENDYINGIYVKKEADTRTECYWRKSYDYKYICYPHEDYGLWSSSRYALQYTDLHIKEGANDLIYSYGNMIANNKFVMTYAMPMFGSKPKAFNVSSNGKYFKRHIQEKCMQSAALTQDGIIYSAYDDAVNEVCELRYIQIDDKLDMVSDKVISGTSGKKWGTVKNLNGADGCIVKDGDGNLYFANKSGVKKILQAETGTISVLAYGNGRYYVVYYYTTSVQGTNQSTFTVRVAESSTGLSWSHKTVVSHIARDFSNYPIYNLLVGFSQENILYRDGKFFLYKYMKLGSTGATRWRVYSTKDFKSFTLVNSSPSYMILPVVPDGGQVLLKLGSDAPSKSDIGLDDSCAISPIYSFSFSGKAQFEKEKIVPFDCLYFVEKAFYGLGTDTDYYGVYIDNLFFEESENNYAVNPRYSSFGSITEYTHKNGG